MLGQHSVHTVLRATAVGLVEGLDWGEILAGLRFGQTQLRLVAVRAVSGALLLDDTYNASPQSTLAALNLLHELDGRKVAVLGDMLELGQYERQGHEMVGYRCAEVADELITIGARARTIAETARSAGMPASKIMEMDSPDEAAALLRTHLSENDVVLVKGSLGMQMRDIVPSLEAQEA
jgi:UDP-N-acetylmuramoyl-tripeptide--D-alanyl-D-alanine ligase